MAVQEKFAENAKKLCDNVEKAIVGKSNEINLVTAALFAGGHVLLEDVPGTGKTMLAKALANSIDCSFGRVQFTPDLLPTELTGLNFYNPKTGEFQFREGSLFANIILADEINRATPRTQSGLLESMEEKQVSVDGQSYVLDKPYFVIATQNPVETRGTFPLPEAQLDRFMLRISLGYPEFEQSKNILKMYTAGNPVDKIEPVLTKEDVLEMQNTVKNVYIHDEVAAYIIKLAQATRENSNIALGVSTRGCLALARLAQSKAAMQGRAYVKPEDVKALINCVFGHRIILRGGGTNKTSKTVLQAITEEIDAPVENWDNIVQEKVKG